MTTSTSPMDWMLGHGIVAWFIISTARINNKLEDCTVAMQTSIVCRSMACLIMSPQYLGTIRLYKRLHWNQQPTSHDKTHTITVCPA